VGEPNRFQDAAEAEAERRHEAAQRLMDDPLNASLDAES
jgi:hypothetical protein